MIQKCGSGQSLYSFAHELDFVIPTVKTIVKNVARINLTYV